MLKDRLSERSQLQISIEEEPHEFKNGELQILLGRPEHHQELTNQFEKHRIPNLTDLAPGPEGFLLRWTEDHKLVAAGIDDRGCLYAVGELLRQVNVKQKSILLPKKLNIRTAPAFEIRGTQYGQSHVAKKLAKVRNWTDEETQRVILDYALAGANIFSTRTGAMFDFIKSYGLMT